MPTDAEGELLRPGEEAGVLSKRGRDEVLHGLNESQPRRHPQVGSHADPSHRYMCCMIFLISKLIDIRKDM